MKKLLLITAALAVLGATTASASGVDLSWAKCPNTVASGADFTYLCDGSGAIHGLQGSFKANNSIPDFAAVDAVVDVGFGGSSVPAYWQFDTAQCDAGALTITNPSTNASCPTQLFAAATSAGGFVLENPAPGRLRIRVAYANGAAAPVAVVAGTLYGGFQLNLDPTVGDAGGANCAGCSSPACLVLNSLTVSGFNVTETPEQISTGDLRQYCTYQGGGIGGSGCPAATPSHSSTWGQVKSLYH